MQFFKLYFILWLQLRAVDTTTGEFGTAALSVQVIPGEIITKSYLSISILYQVKIIFCYMSERSIVLFEN